MYWAKKRSTREKAIMEGDTLNEKGSLNFLRGSE
jgi:hypothetical protein